MMTQLCMRLPPIAAAECLLLIGNDMMPSIEVFLRGSIYQDYKLVIITDHHVRRLYGEMLKSALEKQGHQVLLLSFPAGEKFKTVKTKERLEHQMLQHHCGRETLILALGGGVVGDVAGFVAATYMRGVPYCQLPTTLLAMVDSSIGGKTGINNSYGKNLIGAFWQPRAVIINFDFLKTLLQQELKNGLVEMVKIFLTNDAALFYMTQERLEELLAGERRVLEQCITAAIKMKIKIVEQDEHDKKERLILNFGHTVGHALEKVSHYKISHAHAVALGILVETKISELLGICTAADVAVITHFFQRLQIKTDILKKLKFLNILKAIKSDKKTEKNFARCILLRHIGAIERSGGKVVHPVEDSLLFEALQKMAAI